jgi:ABC-type branched-subunit amino acid transport system ATPase component
MALKNVSFSVRKNSVHCVVGENGAGKSTLIKILAGAEKYTSGRLLLEGKDYCPATIRGAVERGVSALFQELNVIEQLTVEENMTLGNEKSTMGILRKSNNAEHFKDILHSIDPGIAMNTPVSSLSVGKKQILQIVKAIALNAEILILDEPTAALSENETRRLFEAVEKERAVYPVLPVSDTLRRVVVNGSSKMVDRSKFYTVQTPQVFFSKLILPAYRLKYSEKFTDDVSVVEARRMCKPVMMEGCRENIKITTSVDLVIAEAIINGKMKLESGAEST